MELVADWRVHAIGVRPARRLLSRNCLIPTMDSSYAQTEGLTAKREDVGICFFTKHSTDLTVAVSATVHVMAAWGVHNSWLQVTLSVLENLRREGSICGERASGQSLEGMQKET